MRKKLLIGLILLVVTLAIFLGVAILLHRTNPNIRLLGAAETGDLATVKLLVQQGVSMNQTYTTTFGWTPLIAAIYFNQTNVVKYLVESGANVNLADMNGVTPLMWITGRGDEGVPMLRYLIAHGASLDAKNKYGTTVFDYAKAEPPRPKIIEVLEAARLERNKSPDSKKN